MAPSVESLSVTRGFTGGGVLILVNGSVFTDATGVSFGAIPAEFSVSSDSQIQARVPAQAAGTVDVTVTNADGASATNPGDQYTYVAVPVVTGVSPNHGTPLGGDTVTITGSGFSGADDADADVNFGGNSAGHVAPVNDSTIVVSAPGGNPGLTVDVTVRVTVAGFSVTSATSDADRFHYDGGGYCGLGSRCGLGL